MSATYTPPPLHPTEGQEPIELPPENTIQDTTAQNTDDSDLFMDSVMKRKDTAVRNSLANSLKKLKIYPVFGDKEMAQVSINYFLYLEFFHVAIRMFSEVFMVSIFTFVIYWMIRVFCEPGFANDVKLFFNLFNGVIAVFLLKRARGKEESRILNEPMIYNLQWSEDLFSVLVKGLPLDVTEEEVKFFFKSVLSDKVCRIVDVMFVHDYKNYVAKKNELLETKKKQLQLEAEGKAAEASKLTQKIETLEKLMAKYDQDISEMKLFEGKAIVIFETIANQTEVIKFFTYGRIHSLLIFCLRSCFKKHYLRGHRIEVKEIAEPRDLIFENIHRSPIEKALRLALANSLSFIIVVLGIVVVFASEGLKQDAVQAMIDRKFLSYLFAFLTMILAVVLERVYLMTQRILIHTSLVEAKRGLMNYSLYVAFVLYVLTQFGLVKTDIEFGIKQLIRLSMFFALKNMIFKLVEIYSATKAVEHISQHTSSGFLSSIAEKAQKAYEEFNFVKGITLGYPPILIGAAYFCADPFFLLPPLIIILYIYAILDKFRVIKGSKLLVSKSAAFMLRPFSMYRWIPLMSFACNLILVSEGNARLLKETNMWLIWPFYAFSLFGLFGSCCCPRPLHERVKERFVEINDYVTYQSVCDEFTSIYRKEDPYHRNQLVAKSQKV